MDSGSMVLRHELQPFLNSKCFESNNDFSRCTTINFDFRGEETIHCASITAAAPLKLCSCLSAFRIHSYAPENCVLNGFPRHHLIMFHYLPEIRRTKRSVPCQKKIGLNKPKPAKAFTIECTYICVFVCVYMN
ncbi:unnamed protein product [Ceratitis capitata]|uniref:(Mediterranean fruit fly) hypothetical protein n=1 Tax=Ceratitis capitata TaxID=7213 RepID=A0A811UU22_CERCA|nr:unnamed protein product [Ceratitis capitata]